MRVEALLSVGFHVALITVAAFGLPQLWDDPDPGATPILVELVTIAEVTTSRPAPAAIPEEEPELVPEKKPPPPPPPKPAAPPPPKPAAPPPPKPAAPPPPPKPEVAAAEEVITVPAPKPDPKPASEKPAPPEPKPEPTREVSASPRKPAAPVRPREFNPGRIAALIDKSREETAATVALEEPEEEKEEEKKPFILPKPTNQSQLTSSLPLTMSEMDAIRLQIQECWSIPSGALDAENLVIKIRLQLKPDGTLLGDPTIVDQARMNQPGQEYFRIAAESAYRAVKICTPLKNLPPEKYERWRDIVLTFNPRDQLRG